MTGCEVVQCVVVQDSCDRVAYWSHDTLDGTLWFVCIGAILTFLIGGLAYTANGSQRAIENSDDLTDGNVFRSLDELVPALHPSSAGKQARPLEREQDLLKKLHRDVLASSDGVALEGRFSICECEFQEGSQSVLAFL
jgi:hypothetical protein